MAGDRSIVMVVQDIVIHDGAATISVKITQGKREWNKGYQIPASNVPSLTPSALKKRVLADAQKMVQDADRADEVIGQLTSMKGQEITLSQNEAQKDPE